LGVLPLLFGKVRPMPAKIAMKAENHSKEGPINTTVGKSGISGLDNVDSIPAPLFNLHFDIVVGGSKDENGGSQIKLMLIN